MKTSWSIAILPLLVVATTADAASIFKNPGTWLKDTGNHVRRDVENTGRWFREGGDQGCARIERLRGPDAGNECRAKDQQRRDAYSPPPAAGSVRGTFVAIAEVDCLDPVTGRPASWIDMHATSDYSIQDAMNNVDFGRAQQLCWDWNKGRLGSYRWKHI